MQSYTQNAFVKPTLCQFGHAFFSIKEGVATKFIRKTHFDHAFFSIKEGVATQNFQHPPPHSVAKASRVDYRL